jgi:hypothetical protein
MIFHMVYSTHPYFPLHLPQITLKLNTPSHLALFEALLSAIFYGEDERGRRGGRRSCLSAACGHEDTSIRIEWRRATKARPSDVSHFLTLAWQLSAHPSRSDGGPSGGGPGGGGPGGGGPGGGRPGGGGPGSGGPGDGGPARRRCPQARPLARRQRWRRWALARRRSLRRRPPQSRP